MAAPLVVLDTMVVVSALIGREDASSYRVCEAVGTGDVRLALSTGFLLEVSSVVGYPDVETKIGSPARAFRIALDIGLMGDLHNPGRWDWPSVEDPKDAWILDLAWESKADYIVTLDPHLLRAELPFPIEVKTPPEFLAELR